MREPAGALAGASSVALVAAAISGRRARISLVCAVT